MISPRYASVGFVLVVIALFVWIELTDSGKGVADAVKSDAGSPGSNDKFANQ